MTARRMTLKLTFELYGKLEREMTEVYEQFDTDGEDGEETLGCLLASVPTWVQAKHACGSGFATVMYFLKFLRMNDQFLNMLSEIGHSYSVWNGEYPLEDCVKVIIDQEKLTALDRRQESATN